MTRRAITGMILFVCLVLTASTAFAYLPLCTSTSPYGQVCSQGGEVKTSCGDGTFLSGRVSNAERLEDGCFSLSKAKGSTKTTSGRTR